MRSIIEWGIVIVGGVAAAVAALFFPPTPTDGVLFTLFTAISLSLAFVFAVTFGITLLVPLLFPFHLDKSIKGSIPEWTVFYMVLFVVAIVVPWGTAFFPREIIIRVSIVLGVVCLLLLIPYFESVVRRVKSDYIFEALGRQAVAMLQKDNKNIPDAVVSIDNIIRKAFGDHDFETFRKGVKAIAGIPLDFKNRLDVDSKDVKAISKTVFDKFVKVKVRYMDRNDLLDVFNWAELWALEALHNARHEQEISGIIKRGKTNFDIEMLMRVFDKQALGHKQYTVAKLWVTGSYYLKWLREKKEDLAGGVIEAVLLKLKEEDPDILKISYDIGASEIADHFPEYLDVYRQFKNWADDAMELFVSKTEKRI
jgi:hypothetical protein